MVLNGSVSLASQGKQAKSSGGDFLPCWASDVVAEPFPIMLHTERSGNLTLKQLRITDADNLKRSVPNLCKSPDLTWQPLALMFSITKPVCVCVCVFIE